MYKCFMCGKMISYLDIRYHTADKTKIFCGANCSHTYFMELKEKENGKDEV